MSKLVKLLQKLKNGSISASELRNLLKQLGWVLDRQVGSHEQWRNESAISYEKKYFTLATHTKDLKPYQIKEAKKKLLE